MSLQTFESAAVRDSRIGTPLLGDAVIISSTGEFLIWQGVEHGGWRPPWAQAWGKVAESSSGPAARLHLDHPGLRPAHVRARAGGRRYEMRFTAVVDYSPIVQAMRLDLTIVSPELPPQVATSVLGDPAPNGLVDTHFVPWTAYPSPQPAVARFVSSWEVGPDALIASTEVWLTPGYLWRPVGGGIADTVAFCSGTSLSVWDLGPA